LSRRLLLLDAIRAPQTLRAISHEDWVTLLDEAEDARLLGRLIAEADAALDGPPASPALRDRLAGARAFARECERAVAWEVRRLERAFFGCPFRWVLLKGGGYVAAGLPPAVGRRVADIDVLVAQKDLAAAAAALEAHGWHTPELDPYDVKYYREWMHELPPMVHDGRGSIVDLHHAILPRTSRLTADSGVLLSRAVPAGSAYVLCPTHMVIHAAAHLFHDGQISGAVRDLVDLDALFRHFGTHEADFWEQLIADAGELGLERPTFYALRYSSRLLETPIPDRVRRAFASSAPAAPVLAVMDRLVERTLVSSRGGGSNWAATALYVRSHWLRMPPVLLFRHLLRKATR
jgi:hypothetical protein